MLKQQEEREEEERVAAAKRSYLSVIYFNDSLSSLCSMSSLGSS
jgi:hypothetical protein